MARACLELLATAACGSAQAAMHGSAIRCFATSIDTMPSGVTCALASSRSSQHTRDGAQPGKHGHCTKSTPAVRGFSSVSTGSLKPERPEASAGPQTSNPKTLSPAQAAEQLWHVARKAEAEKNEVRQRFEEHEVNASRQQAIKQLHKGKNYTHKELSERLWSLVTASEELTGRTREDSESGEQPLEQLDAGQAVEAPPARPPVASPQQAQVHKYRRSAVFEDIGVPQQAAWYEIATGDPLSHKESHTLIHLHSVNMFHAASVDCTRSIMQLLRPSLLAVLLPNDQQGDLLVSAQARLQAVRSGDHLQRIADGYHRICMDIEEVSAFNTTVDDLRRSYREGQRVARLHHLPDYATVTQDLQDQPDALAHFEEAAQDPVLMRQLWHAMFLSGMLPQEHYDRAIVEAHAAGHPVFCVDMSEQHQAHEAEQYRQSMLPEADDGSEEAEQYLKAMLKLTKNNLPLNLPEDVWSVMAPAVLYPGQMEELYEALIQTAPCTWHMMRTRAAYTARALQHLATESPSVPDGGEERRMLCLVDRGIEPLVRAQWSALMEKPEDCSEHEASLVHSLPFMPRAIDKNKRSRRRGNAAKQ